MISCGLCCSTCPIWTSSERKMSVFRRAQDPAILEWAAREGRILLTHDVSTMKPYAFERVANGLPMPGVFVVSQIKPLALIIEHLILLTECSLEGEWEGRVRHVPL